MVKRFVNILLIFILAVQVLPVLQIGAALFDNQFTEEIPHSLDGEKDEFKKLSGKSEFLDCQVHYYEYDKAIPKKYLITKTEAIPQANIIEVLVPPPNI